MPNDLSCFFFLTGDTTYKPAISLSRFRDWKPFFVQEQFYIAEPCYLGLTQMDSDARRCGDLTQIDTDGHGWDTDFFLIFLYL